MLSKKETFKAFRTIRRALQNRMNVPENLFKCLSKCDVYFENETLYKSRVSSKITDYVTKITWVLQFLYACPHVHYHVI